MEPKSKRVRLDTTYPNLNNDFVKLLAIIDVKDWQSAVELKNSLMTDPVIATLVGKAKRHVHNMVPMLVNAGVHQTSSCRPGDMGKEPSLSSHMPFPHVNHRVRCFRMPTIIQVLKALHGQRSVMPRLGLNRSQMPSCLFTP